MKDLRKAPTLAGAIQDGKLPQSTLERLGIAHEVAKTVVYLHSVEVLVKRLSDKTVLLTSENGTFKPYLTDLENARLVNMVSFSLIRNHSNTDQSSKKIPVEESMISVMRPRKYRKCPSHSIASIQMPGA
ncbi:hypothetical protein GQ44DRAFT_720472 [Phaeosphaeriaceae sp. PMI808]|nr:hypothetical protein GQ44DRAFT_720472 [Phaeosphaeriaceae sp. PMI808]